MTTKAITPLRQRMIEDMNARELCAGTQRGHIRACKRFAAFLKRSPEKLHTTERARPPQRSGSIRHDLITAVQRSLPDFFLLACSPPQPSLHSYAQFADSCTRKHPAQPTARSFAPTRSH
jgi:hypothetical protein